MTLSLPASVFESAGGLRRARPARLPRPHGERAAGLGVAVLAHLALAVGLVFGIHAVRAPAEQPMFVDIVEKKIEPERERLPPPRLAPPAPVVVPPPLIEIAPPPAPPPVSAAPAPPVPAPPPAPAMPARAQTPWDGQAGYVASLLAYLERFKQYPSAARAAHIEGAVLVHFVMARDGRVLSAEIAKSSGRPVLDREALAMIARAGRLPPMPPQMKGEVLDGIIGPIRFTLR